MALTRRQFGLSAIALGSIAACGSSMAQPVEKLRIAYANGVPSSDTTFIFAAKQLGFFKEQGLDVEIQTTAGTVAAAGLVASGAMDLAIGGLEPVPGYVAKGVPMKAVYVHTYSSIFSVGFLKGSSVQTLEGLKGAKIGVFSLGSGSIPVLEYLLRTVGLTLKDVKLIPIGFGPAALAAIGNNAVDALAFHDLGFAGFQASGIELTVYESPKLKGYPGQGVLGLDNVLRDRKKAVEGFLRGLTKGLVYSVRNPAGATKAFGEYSPEAAKNPALEEKLWRERLKIVPLPPEAHGQWGYMEDRYFDTLVDVLVTGGVIKEKIPAAKLYTTAFLKAANDVDVSNLR
jgi:NitT/TauT family transport system substrate-binding protein